MTVNRFILRLTVALLLALVVGLVAVLGVAAIFLWAAHASGGPSVIREYDTTYQRIVFGSVAVGTFLWAMS